MGKKNSLFNVKPGDTLSFGVIRVAAGVQFSVYLPDGKDCKLKFYYTGRKHPACIISLTNEYKRGGVYFITITGINGTDTSGRSLMQILSQDFEYMYEADGMEFADPYAHIIHGRQIWGKVLDSSQKKLVRSGICLDEFDWEDDCQIIRPFDEVILYQLHVRGYTKHPSSGVKNKGTYKGLVEKIPYMKELGINAVLLLPCYEFNEVQEEVCIYNGRPVTEDHEKEASEDGSQNYTRLNYWGYGADGTYYLAPKTAYASDKSNVVNEFKNFVKSFHKEGIEVLMDIYFSPGTNLCLMTDCLRNWVLEYHIDGFRVNNDVMPALALVSDPVLSGVKMLASYWDKELLQIYGTKRSGKLLAEYNEGFMNDARRFLKSDEGMTGNFAERFRRNSSDYSIINFITHVNGFTLMDLVSYDIKHNESNGEMNRDGTDYNYSWNCGAEGRSRKQTIIVKRMRQIRNAFIMLLLSQGTPMILAGDEFGNTQSGNNNAYCHDDNVTWLNWRHNKRETEILAYVKKLISFRKEHPVLRQPGCLPMYDIKGLGLPALSIHGTQAWRADYSNYSRMAGFLLNGGYADNGNGGTDDIIYIIFNMYWESKTFDIPSLPAGKKWYTAITTYDDTFYEIPVKKKKTRTSKNNAAKPGKNEMELQRKTVVPPRSVVVFIGR
ncbi:MAG TPA: alpha-amylase [Lachnospiraceae bacterium]|nr:alpha-amylase [Lachnospiraceae bacterium]